MVHKLIELYSTGMALGYIKTDVKNSVQGVPKKYLYPFKSRIDKVVQSADIELVVHDEKPYLIEEISSR